MHALKPLKKALTLAFGGGVSTALLVAAPAFAQTTDGNVQRVEVTGSSIKRIDAESALPVQILNREDIARTGVSNAEQLLKTISATSTLGAASVANTGAGGGQGGTNSVSLVSLRGLGSARTLVLINGRRSAPAAGSSAVDIATIPVGLIERVEVLKDGASAVYGSDAMAGVVNFILRRDFSGAEVSATIGAPTRAGGGTETRVSLLAGFGDFDARGFSGTLTGSYATVKPIFGSDRSFARNINVAEQLDKTSTTAFPANVRLPNGQIVNPNYPNCGPYSIVSPLTTLSQCRYDNAPYIALQPESKLANVAAAGRLKLGASFEGYAEASVTRNQTLNTTQHVLINGAALPAGHPYIASLTNLINTRYSTLPAAQVTQLRSLVGSAWAFLPPTSPYYPTAFASANGLTGQPLVLLFRSIPTGVRKTEDIDDNTRFVAGVRGSLLGWDVDVGGLLSKNKITTNLTQGWVLTDKYLNLVNTGVINPFGDTTDAAARQAAMDSNYNGLFNTTTTKVTGIDAKASRELFSLAGGAAGLALGAEFRKESLDIAPSDANKQFLISGFGAPGVAIAADRKVASTYAELNLPFLKTLEVNAAVRYDKYQRVGDTTNPKASVKWRPIEPVLLRASIGTGFRAPTLTDLYSPEARGITTNGSRDLVRCPIGTTGLIDCSTQFVTIGGGNPNLKPEKSTSYTLGLVAEPLKELSIGIDMFKVDIDDVIRTSLSTATILADPVRYASFINRGAPDGNPSGAGPITGILQGLVNLGKIKVEGIDVDVKGRVALTPGDRLTLRLNGTYTSKYDTQNTDGTFSSSINNPAAIGIGVVLRWRHTLSATWESGPWAATLAENYQVGYRDLRTALQPASVAPRQVGSYETYDMQVSYKGFKSVKLSAGVKNLFDRDPPYTNYGAGFVGSYDLSYTDVRGRFAYLNATYAF
jgi:iron complex outermembrane receptor protein